MAVEMVRHGGKFEAIGFVLILIGTVGYFSAIAIGVSGIIVGTLLCAAGFVVFLIGRFMSAVMA